jgi:KDO2-lipid IV(A) lauroyltransferase
MTLRRLPGPHGVDNTAVPGLGVRSRTATLAVVKSLGDAVIYLLFRLSWAGLRLIPLTPLRAILEALGRGVWLLDRRHRDVVAANLRIAFPGWPAARRAAAERQAFANWGRIAAELLHFDEIARARGTDDPTIRALEEASTPLLARGRGLLVLTAHTGNFELLARLWGRATGVEIAVFHRAMRNGRIDAFLRDERAACAFRVVERGSMVREALRILAAGGVFVVPLDQNQLPGRGIFVDLFGTPASTTTLLARLALATGAPVLPVFAAWEGAATTAVIFPALPSVDDLPEVVPRERSARIATLTAAYSERVEAAIRLHPSQWNWAHRRWKTRPESDPENGAGTAVAAAAAHPRR